MGTKHEVIEEELAKYLKAGKEQKGLILNRLTETLKIHRKALVRRFGVLQKRSKTRV